MKRFFYILTILAIFDFSFSALADSDKQNKPKKTSVKIYEVKRMCDKNKAAKVVDPNEGDNIANLPIPKGCKEGEEVKIRLFTTRELLGDYPRISNCLKSIDEMNQQNYPPADWTTIIPLIKKYPHLEWIVGFGGWPYPNSDHRVPIYFKDNSKHILSLWQIAYGNCDHLFLAAEVHK